MKSQTVLLAAALAVFPALASADGFPSEAVPSGVSGVIALKPGCPGPQKKDDDCHKPLPEKTVQLVDSTGKVAASATSDANGKFVVNAKPGKYSLKVVIDALYPRCPQVEVQVRKHSMADADILCDSGMR